MPAERLSLPNYAEPYFQEVALDVGALVQLRWCCLRLALFYFQNSAFVRDATMSVAAASAFETYLMTGAGPTACPRDGEPDVAGDGAAADV